MKERRSSLKLALKLQLSRNIEIKL